MPVKTILSFFLLLLLASSAGAQSSAPVFGEQEWINGYARNLQGEELPYFSVYPDEARQALLTRCTDGQKIIEWTTDPVPGKGRGKYVYFTWIAAHSSGTSSGDRQFDLYINDVLALTFTTQAKKYPPSWTFAGQDSTRIVFEFKTKDGANDSHGLMYLRVPRSACKKGQPLKLKIVGHAQQSNDWYMTFEYAFKEKIVVEPMPFLLRDTSNRRQLLRCTVLHFGPPATFSISAGSQAPQSFPVSNGFNLVELAVPAVSQTSPLNISAHTGKQFSIDTIVTLHPVKFREIDLVHHAHTDIGYSALQADVIRIHTANIRRALKLIEATKDYPEESRFKWNIESSWAVENFLSEASAQEKKDFISAVRSGQIMISGTYANLLTGLCTPEEMNWMMRYAVSLRDSLGLPVNTAMMSDIPGMSWSMVPALAQNGIRYFSNGPNYVAELPDRGDRIGHILRDQGDKMFWWKSASGRDSILFWTCGRGYSSWHRFAEGAVWDRGPEKIAAYMNDLDTAGYPYALVQWRYNIVSDNGPTDSTISAFVKNWNEKYASPKLVLANAADLFARFEKRYGKDIPVCSGDLTPYWEDGAYSTAREEGSARRISETLLSLENIAAQEKVPVPGSLSHRAEKYLLLFHEHTWGSWNSISDPDNPFTTQQWACKKAYLDSAMKYVEEIESLLDQQIAAVHTITVVNTLPWSRAGQVRMKRPAWFTGNVVIDSTGWYHYVQDMPGGEMSFNTPAIPAHGHYRLKPANDPFPKKSETVTMLGPGVQIMPYPKFDSSGTILRLPLTSWNDYSPIKMGHWPMALYKKGIAPETSTAQKFLHWESGVQGPAFSQASISCSLDGTDSIRYEFTNPGLADVLIVSVIIDKKAVREKESIHIALPFAIAKPVLRIGSGDSFYEPDKGQLPGANHDYYSVQRWIDLSNDTAGFTVCSLEGALFECGTTVNETRSNAGYKAWKEHSGSSSTLWLYALNNYWHTNYKIDQEGKIRFDLYITRHKAFDPEAARRFGYEMTQPLKGF